MAILKELEKIEHDIKFEKKYILDSQRVELNSIGIPLLKNPLRATLVEQELTRDNEISYIASLEFSTYTPVTWLLPINNHESTYWNLREFLNKGEGYEVKITSEGLISIESN